MPKAAALTDKQAKFVSEFLVDSNGTQAAILQAAHGDLLHRSLTCTMDLRPRIAPWDASLRQVCAGVQHVATELGFTFN